MFRALNNRKLRLAFSIGCLIALGTAYPSITSTARRTPTRTSSTDTSSRNRPGTLLASPRLPGLSATLDSDGDGIPDSAELSTFTDRENFRLWFTAIAEMQFYQLSDAWNPNQRDCAGLVRFAWREALRHHDRQWLLTIGKGYEAIAPDVAAYNLDTSELGEKIFRTTTGSYNPKVPLDESFSEFADARTLKAFNTEFVSRDRALARPGDLLFFHQPSAQKFPYHAMIFLGEARVNSDGARDWVVYHTGASIEDEGTVKKVRLAVLDHHPDKRWRPTESNPNFLGYFRLKILQ